MLVDTQAELNNLVDDPSYANQLQRLRGALHDWQPQGFPHRGLVMHRYDLQFFLLILWSLQGLPLASACGRIVEAGAWSPPSSLQSLPVIEGLPDVFIFADGRKAETPEDWDRRREELKAALLYYQFGSMPPRPDRVTVVESSQSPHDSGLGTVEFLTFEIDSVKKLRFHAAFYLPKHAGRRPVIIREEGNLGRMRSTTHSFVA